MTTLETETVEPAQATGQFVAYEYLTIRAPRQLEALYKDTYSNFGWSVEGYGAALPSVDAVSVKLKRDRRIKNRAMVLELERTSEQALATIATLERSKGVTAMSAAIGAGIAGSGLLAGSVFLLESGSLVLSIVLGTVGLLGWVAGYFAFARVKANRTAKVAPLIDRQYELVYEASEKASRLIA